MKRILLLSLVTWALVGSSAAQTTFTWVRANNEAVQLDPADYHTGRVYHPGPSGATFTLTSKPSSRSRL